MKVLSVRPPWSDLIALGIKKVEFRSWKTSYRGPVVIHASKRVDTANREAILRWLERPWKRTWTALLDEDTRKALRGFLLHPRRGVCLCVADLTSVDKSEYHESVLGFSPESYGWVFENVRNLRREVPLRGKLGLFSLNPSQKALIERAIFEAPPDIRLDLTRQTPDGKAIPEPEETVYRQGNRKYVKRGLFKVPVED